MSLTVALETLGCKINQYESSYLLEALTSAGYTPVSFRDSADVYIVHGCAVTSKAGFQTRQLLRRARRLNPQAHIVATGCEAQAAPERLVEERLATHVLGTMEKVDIVRWLKEPADWEHPCVAVGDPRRCRSLSPLPVSHMHTGRTRAFLKVQDGCDAFCSYCIVPHTRGAGRSLPRAEVRAQMDRFLAAGYKEVVLTGIHLGKWGRDFTPPQSLAGLLRFLRSDGRPLPARLRLSSLEAGEWANELLSVLDDFPGLCPHFHVPLQSGDATVLSRMHRPYGPQIFADVIRELHHRFPEAALGADVMVGFPGEEASHFQNTVRLISGLPLTYLHVFPYSARPGTPAAGWPDRVTGSELKRRARTLQALSGQKREAFRKGFIGRCVEVLVESRGKGGLWQGITANYLQVRFAAPLNVAAGALVNVRIRAAADDGLIGEVIGTAP